jgi:hypothetical protein
MRGGEGGGGGGTMRVVQFAAPQVTLYQNGARKVEAAKICACQLQARDIQPRAIVVTRRQQVSSKVLAALKHGVINAAEAEPAEDDHVTNWLINLAHWHLALLKSHPMIEECDRTTRVRLQCLKLQRCRDTPRKLKSIMLEQLKSQPSRVQPLMSVPDTSSGCFGALSP